MLFRKRNNKVLAFLDTLAKLQQATFGFIMSVRVEQLSCHWTDFHEMLCPRIFRKYFERIKNLTKLTASFHEDLCTFVIMSGAFVFRMRNFSDKNCRGNKNTVFMLSDSCTKVPSVRYGTSRQATDDNITWRMRFACWITKARCTLVTLPRNVTPYRDSVDGTCDHVTCQKLVTRLRYGLVRCAVGIWPSHQRDDTVMA